ncbi:MAG: class I SAM-dependent methyltransferase [Thermoproteota archaeon]
MKSESFYQRYWTDFYGWSPSGVKVCRLERELFYRYLRPGIRVIDFGSGDCSHYGDIILSLQVNYIGLDVSKIAVQRCHERGLNAIVHDLNEPTPFSNNSFDVALCFEVLEHLFQPDIVLREIYRVLKPGGVALITVPNVAFLPNRFLFLLGFFNPGGSPATSLRAPWKDPHIRFFTKDSLVRLLKEIGFVISEFNGDFSFAHFPVIYKFSWIRRIADLLSVPLKPLGRYWPSVFAFRFFVVAKKIS